MLTHLAALAPALAGWGVPSWVAGPPESLQRLRARLAAGAEGFELPALELPLGDGLRPWRDLKAARRLCVLIQRVAPDVLHAHGHKAALTAALALQWLPRRLRPPLVVTVHNFLPPRRPATRERLERWVAGRALAPAARVIAVSRTLEGFLRGLPVPGGLEARLRVVPNGLAGQRIAASAAPEGASLPAGAAGAGVSNGATAPEPFGVACVARLTPLRGVEEVVEAAALAARRVTGLQVWLVGDGPLRAGLVRRARCLGLGGRVHFPGYHPDPGVLLARAHVAVLPWLREGASYSALEAMAMGLPVIAFDCPGAREVVPRDGGLLVPPGSVGALADAMAALAADPERRRRLGLGARRAAASRTAREMAQHTLTVYREARPLP